MLHWQYFHNIIYIYTHTMPWWDFFFFFFVVGLKYSLIINLLLQCQETCSSFGWYLLPFQSLDIHGSEPPLPNYWIIKKNTSTPNIIFLSMLHKLNRRPPPPKLSRKPNINASHARINDSLTDSQTPPPTYFCLLISSLFFSTGFPPPKDHFLV